MLELETIIKRLDDENVEYLLTGSVAAAAFGVPVTPRDVDVTPATTGANLRRVAAILEDWRARPKYDPNWPYMTEEDCANWTADPPTEENLDQLFETPLGLFDVVPWRAGRFDDLRPRALDVVVGAVTVLVAHPTDLLATMRPNQQKHQTRRPYLESAEAALARGTLTVVSPVDAIRSRDGGTPGPPRV